MKNKALYKITALSNLHMGSGDQNYGIVDKLVQRDPLTGFPVIHSSSLKGALKVYCEDILVLAKDNPFMITSFGSGDNPGKDKFFSAHIFTLPVRSNKIPFYRATCPAILNEVIIQLQSFGLGGSTFSSAIMQLYNRVKNHNEAFLLFKDMEGLIIEDIELVKDSYHPFNQNEGIEIFKNFKYDQDSFIVIRDDVFMEICENLPVIARNRLDGQKNLWYEEVVPRQSEFLFLYLGTDETKGPIMDEIVKHSVSDIPVQIGANASVGYGFCKIEIAAV